MKVSIKGLCNTWVFLGMLGLILVGCDAATSSSSSSDGDGDGEIQVDPDVDGFAVAVTQNDNYSVLISKDGDGETACVAEEGELITCIIDMEELDLFINGYTIEYSMPQAECDYQGYFPYHYSWAPYGEEPIAVLYQVDEDGFIQDVTGAVPGGVFINPVTSVAPAACPGSNLDIVYVYADGDEVCHGEIFPSRAIESGEVKCAFDYSEFDNGENCCAGDYTTISYDTTAAEMNDASESDWGDDSNIGNCFRGPGMDDSNTKNSLGLPAYIYTLVPTEGLQSTYKVDSPISTGHDDQIYASNYFVAGDHTGNVATSSAGLPGNVASAPVLAADGHPWFQFDCLDHADELKAQIRILVREWNTEAAFDTFVSSQTLNSDVGGTGDPYDVSANEGLDDFSDYKGLEDNGGLVYSSFGLTTTPAGDFLDSIFNPSTFYGNFSSSN